MGMGMGMSWKEGRTEGGEGGMKVRSQRARLQLAVQLPTRRAGDERVR